MPQQPRKAHAVSCVVDTGHSEDNADRPGHGHPSGKGGCRLTCTLPSTLAVAVLASPARGGATEGRGQARRDPQPRLALRWASKVLAGGLRAASARLEPEGERRDGGARAWATCAPGAGRGGRGDSSSRGPEEERGLSPGTKGTWGLRRQGPRQAEGSRLRGVEFVFLVTCFVPVGP